MRSTSKSVMYDVVKDWRLAPQVWGYFARLGITCVVVGFILAFYVMGQNDQKQDGPTHPDASGCGGKSKPVLLLEK